MRPWLHLLAVVLHVLICQGAWIRKYPCGAWRPDFPSSRTPFWIDSIRGGLNAVGDSTELLVSILGVHNVSLFDCQDVDLVRFEDSLAFHVLGHPVGRLGEFKSQCPLPITNTLTP